MPVDSSQKISKTWILVALLLLGALAAIGLRSTRNENKPSPSSVPAAMSDISNPSPASNPSTSAAVPQTTKSTGNRTRETPRPSSPADVEALKREMMAQLDSKDPVRTLSPPDDATLSPTATPTSDWHPAAPPVVVLDPARAERRKTRETLPLGVVLVDNVPVYAEAKNKKILYQTMTGDLVRVYPDAGNGRVRIHPGLDVYLAATTRDTRAAGDRLPDQPGWVDADKIQVMEHEDARDFLRTTDSVSLGNDPSFSTLAFYERAMKNPDPVVHQVVGPRLMAIAALHDEYGPTWSTLIRDRDPKIRSLALSAIKGRGVGDSRPLVEDLIARLAELTQYRVTGEKEEEALFVLSVLTSTGLPRVASALLSFSDTWKAGQSDRLNTALQDAIQKTQNGTGGK